MYVHPPSFWVPYKRNPISEEMKKAAIAYLDKGETLFNRLEECLWFEKELARYLGKKHAVSLNSGTKTGGRWNLPRIWHIRFVHVPTLQTIFASLQPIRSSCV